MISVSVVLLFQYWVRNERHIAELETATLLSELEQLLNQVNPHFLFNMLNNIIILTKTNPGEAANVLAVKHNNDNRRLSFVRLRFGLDNDTLCFECVNSKPLRPMRRDEAGGLGLPNVRRRLDLLYGNRHRLEITENDTIYSVRLTIELKNKKIWTVLLLTTNLWDAKLSGCWRKMSLY